MGSRAGKRRDESPGSERGYPEGVVATCAKPASGGKGFPTDSVGSDSGRGRRRPALLQAVGEPAEPVIAAALNEQQARDLAGKPRHLP
jgi:hypothetical protein